MKAKWIGLLLLIVVALGAVGYVWFSQSTQVTEITGYVGGEKIGLLEDEQVQKILKDKYRLSLGGISAPKEGEKRRGMKKPPALEHFLKEHPKIQEIEICTDNDFAGRWACAHLKEAYGASFKIIENLPQLEGADYGDLAKMKKEQRPYTKTEKVR